MVNFGKNLLDKKFSQFKPEKGVKVIINRAKRGKDLPQIK